MSGDVVYVDMVLRCKVIDGDYEICINYHVGGGFVSIDMKFVERKVLKKLHVEMLNYRELVVDTLELFVSDDNPIRNNLGYVIYKYELMDGELKQNEFKYGEFNSFNSFGGFVHYFDVYELELESWFTDDDVFIECSTQIEDLPFKMCMKAVSDNINGDVDIVLYFEKDVNDMYEIDETYSFEIKEYIDNAFENNIFSFNE
eukprot:UN11891